MAFVSPTALFTPALSHARGASSALRRTQFLAPARRACSAARRGSTPAMQPSMVAAQSVEDLKRITGYKAVDDHVESNMVVGLGTGSTAYYAVERLGQKLESGDLTDVVAIPTSVRTRDQALSLKIPLVTLDTHPVIDVAIDGADEVDAALNLVKGRGGALLREKMVETQAKKFVVIVDDSKLVDGLGTTGAMPVEVTPFCFEFNLKRLQELESVKGCKARLRMKDDERSKPYLTDNDNYIIDLFFKTPIKDPRRAAKEIANLVGVVDHGLFLGMSSVVIIAAKDGIEVRTK